MLVLKLRSNEIIRITIGGRHIRLIQAESTKHRLGIECPDDCVVERFRVSDSDTFDSLADLEKRTGFQIGGRQGPSSAQPPTAKPAPKNVFKNDFTQNVTEKP